MATKSFYFPHDRNVRNNAKVMNLIKHEGMAGYGAYWVIMEYLHAQDGYTALLDSVSYIARLCSSNIRKLKRIVMEYDLFVIEGDSFHSEELIQKMQPFERKFGQTLNQESDKKDTARSDKSLKTSEKTFSPDEVYNNINNNKKKIKEKISSSEDIQKKVASPKPQVSEEEEILVKPVVSESCTSAPAPGWETWVDMLGKDESWKKLMSQRTRLHKFFFILFDRVMLIFKNHIRGMGKEHTIRSLNDAKRYFFCFVDPDSYTGKRLSARMRDEIEYWKGHNPFRFEDDNPDSNVRTYWDGLPIPADAPPRPNDYVMWNTQTASWQ